MGWCQTKFTVSCWLRSHSQSQSESLREPERARESQRARERSCWGLWFSWILTFTVSTSLHSNSWLNCKVEASWDKPAGLKFSKILTFTVNTSLKSDSWPYMKAKFDRSFWSCLKHTLLLNLGHFWCPLQHFMFQTLINLFLGQPVLMYIYRKNRFVKILYPVVSILFPKLSNETGQEAQALHSLRGEKSDLIFLRINR